MMNIEDIADKFKNLYAKMKTDTFLSRSSLGGEIPFWRSPYNPEQELEVSKSIKGLKNKLENDGLIILDLNLFDVSMELLQEHLGEGEIFELEQQMDKDELKEAIQSVLDINEVFMLNNGWKIVLGRGLDIWQKTSGWYDIAEYYQEKRLCKACEVTFLRG